jgi:hypothetical protein
VYKVIDVLLLLVNSEMHTGVIIADGWSTFFLRQSCSFLINQNDLK